MQNFDFNEALKGIQAGKPITGSDGVLAPLIKHLKLECMVLTAGVIMTHAVKSVEPNLGDFNYAA